MRSESWSEGLCTNDTFRALRAFGPRPLGWQGPAGAASGRGDRVPSRWRFVAAKRASRGRGPLVAGGGARPGPGSDTEQAGAPGAASLRPATAWSPARWAPPRRSRAGSARLRGAAHHGRDREDPARLLLSGVAGGSSRCLPFWRCSQLRDRPDSPAGGHTCCGDPANPYGALLPWPARPQAAMAGARPLRSVGPRVCGRARWRPEVGRSGRQLLTFMPPRSPIAAASPRLWPPPWLAAAWAAEPSCRPPRPPPARRDRRQAGSPASAGRDAGRGRLLPDLRGTAVPQGGLRHQCPRATASTAPPPTWSARWRGGWSPASRRSIRSWPGSTTTRPSPAGGSSRARQASN